LALQTHPLAILVLLPLAASLARAGRAQGWLWGRWTALALLAALIAYSPLLIDNLRTGFGGVDDALRLRSDYESGEPFGLDTYLRNASALPVELAQVLAGSFAPPDEALADPALAPAAALLVLALLWASRRGLWLPLACAALTALALPLVNPRYSVVTDSRYLMSLLPFLLVAAAALAEDALRWARA